ncbi:MAG: 3-methyl-2-oxobutanoate dehydrogenase subunit VorB [Oscillospiraceae bacterium]|jgi:2-oxoglutarate ferredoxin oxidoreductase subunit alpha|nr:3-methyl-2-oxobutanoate dehydrogenase subunit VorB [Oscillospiraceae bacterium]
MSEKVLIKGNEAIAEAAIAAGCRHFFGYPITPQNELAAHMSRRMPKVDGVFLQAESEVAAINMIYGASAAGVRCMTSSSSPGISLKAEGLSYLAGCDLPAVVVNVQRGGPGLGSIQPSQADYFQATRGGGHGDYHILVLAPNSVQEMYSHTIKAFDLADRYRMTVMILTDGFLGQMMEPVVINNEQLTTNSEKPWAVTQGKGKNIINSLFLKPDALEKSNLDRYAKYQKVEESEPLHEGYLLDDAEIVVASYGASSRIARNAIDEARGRGIKAGLLRPVTLWPFPKKAFAKAAEKARAFVSVEMSMGQMIEDVELAIRCRRPVLLCSRVGGVAPEPAQILASILEADKEKAI